MNRFLLDQGLPRRAAQTLVAAGWDVVHVADVAMARASDKRILDHAREQNRTVVTLDSDFARLLATEGADHPSVIHIRLQGLDLRATGDLLDGLFRELQGDLDAGVIVSVTQRGYRVRNLPILKPTPDSQEPSDT
ncbi:MAG: DUF5615 family PIN-like protein [Deltaproteobacteria bacterium]|nr:DUF5615 family PIN-like protein [Deltaproteobacteria bacterium]